MSDYKPTTEVVRTDYIRTQFTDVDAAGAEFDRWLDEVKAQAWEKGFQGGHDSAMGVSNTKNPYRQGEK